MKCALVKIGQTERVDVAQRMAELYTTGLPFPFELKFACRVTNSTEVETALHTAFGPQRVNPRREFFKLEPDQVIAILKLLHTEDTTAEVSALATPIDSESLEAARVYKAKRPNLNYHEMGIPDGAILRFTKGDAEVVVCGPKKVRYRDEETSLTAVTRQLLQMDYSIQPTPYWTYNGKPLSEIYEETYESDAE